MSRLISPLAALGLLALALLLAALWLTPGPLAGLRHWQPPAAQAPQLDDVYAALLQANPAAAVQPPELVARPLFSPTRRPPPPPPPPGAKPAPAPEPEPNPFDGLKLLGVIQGPTLSGVMLAQGEATRFLPLGDILDGWTLKRLGADHVIFERKGKKQRVNLATAHLGDAANPPPAESNFANTRAGAWPRPAAPASTAAEEEPSADDEADEPDAQTQTQPTRRRPAFGGAARPNP